MYLIIFVVFICFPAQSVSSGSPGDSSHKIPESVIHDVQLNSNLKGLSLAEYLEAQDLNESQLTSGLGVIPSTPVISSCAAFIDYFGEVSANFTKCVVSYARPLRVCENCIEEYLRAKGAFDLVMKGRHKDEHNADCGDLILNSDRVQIIVRAFSFIEGIWNDCDCNNCFDFLSSHNSTIHYRLSNDTMRFHDLAVETMNCFHNSSSMQPIHHNHTGGKNNSAVCHHCRHIYHELNELYERLENTYHHRVCMDIVDTINSTRLEWSKTYGCSVKEVDPTPVFIISGLFCLLPIFFYLGNCLYVTRQQRETQKQTGPEGQDDTDVNDSS